MLQHKLELVSPPVYVNKKACATKDYLFIQSGLKADNDIDELWDNNTVIDVYSIKNGKYLMSLYLPDFKGIKLKDFKVFEHTLYALHGNYLYKYKLLF